jgi:hypothetical protein
MTTDHAPPKIADTIAAMVAERLRALGRDPAMVTEDALAALCETHSGSRRKLQTRLTSALFLASTENAPEVTADHVARAAAMQPEPEPVTRVMQPRTPMLRLSSQERPLPSTPLPSTPLPSTPLPSTIDQSQGRPALWRAALVAAIFVVSTAIMVSYRSGPPHPATTPSPQGASSAQTQAVATAPPIQPHQTLPPLRDPIAVPTPPPIVTVPQAPADAPGVIIDFAGYDRNAWPRAASLAAALRGAGINVLRFEAIRWYQRPAVHYYAPQDRSSAEHISSLFSEAGVAMPVRRDSGLRRYPGTIRVVLP